MNFIQNLFLLTNREEAERLPDYIIGAWPTNVTRAMIPEIHKALAREDGKFLSRRVVVRLEDVGLSYPLTDADLMEHWEEIDRIWMSLTNSERDTISRNARQMVDDDSNQ